MSSSGMRCLSLDAHLSQRLHEVVCPLSLFRRKVSIADTEVVIHWCPSSRTYCVWGRNNIGARDDLDRDAFSRVKHNLTISPYDFVSAFPERTRIIRQ